MRRLPDNVDDWDGDDYEAYAAMSEPKSWDEMTADERVEALEAEFEEFDGDEDEPDDLWDFDDDEEYDEFENDEDIDIDDIPNEEFEDDFEDDYDEEVDF